MWSNFIQNGVGRQDEQAIHVCFMLKKLDTASHQSGTIQQGVLINMEWLVEAFAS